jgi:hypothetical protein
MGGTTGIYYGRREFTDDEIHGDNTEFLFEIEHIEGSTMPIVNDLILNIPDGGFYKVISVLASGVLVSRIAIAGGGGVGGNTGGGTASSFTVSVSGNKAKAYSATTTALPISFTCNYAGESTNRIA